MEKLIYSTNLNQTEFLRSLSLKGTNTFSYRIFNFDELVMDANIRLGLLSHKPIMNIQEEEFFAIRVLKELDINPNSYEDVKHFVSTLKDVRKSIKSLDEYNEFLTKLENVNTNINFKLLNVFYKKYLEMVKSEETIDVISLSRELFGKGELYDEIIYFKEDDLSPLEIELLYELANKVTPKSYVDLFPKVEKKTVKSIKPYYGNLSQINGIISDILENKYSFSDVLIITSNKDDTSALLYEKYLKDNIPFTSEFGIPITLTGPFLLYKCLFELRNTYFFTKVGFKKLFNCPYFDISKIIDDLDYVDILAEICGNLKIEFDNKKENVRALESLNYLNQFRHDYLIDFIKQIDRRFDPEKLISYTYNIIDIFSKGILYILDNYFIDNSSLKDEKQKEYVINLNSLSLEYITSIISQSYEIKDNDLLRISYVKMIENKFIFPKSFNDKGIHLTTLQKAINTNRKHVYFINFDASSFPGKVAEDYLFNDKEYSLLTNEESARSVQKILNRNKLFRNIININLDSGNDVSLSYIFRNILDASSNNPSSVLLEYDGSITNKKEKLEDLISKNRYFDDRISPLGELVETALNNKERVIKEIPEIDVYSKKDLLKISFSPSSMSDFFKCPLYFYLTKLLYLKDENEELSIDDFVGNKFGNLVHLAMYFFIQNSSMSEDEFDQLLLDLFDSYNRFNKSLLADKNKDAFIESSHNAYRFLKQFDLKNVHAEYEIKRNDNISLDDIYFHGDIDLVIKDKDEVILIDYKTNNNVKHDEKDIDSLLQLLIYSYLFEKKNNIKVKQALFYYTKFDKVVNVDIKGYREQFHKKMEDFKETLKSNKFEPANKKCDLCKYCLIKNRCEEVKAKCQTTESLEKE